MAWTLCVGIGLCSGFLAGLLGVGGGAVIVPALILAAQSLGFEGDEAASVAIATSLAIIIPTSIASACAHAAHGAIDWPAFRRLAPGIVAGALCGRFLAAVIGGRATLALFIAFALYSIRRLVARAPVANPRTSAAPVPEAIGLSARAFAIGLLSALVGVGGALLSVPVLARHLPMKRAIGTAAALGLPLAAAAVMGSLLAGRPGHCLDGCVGYVFLPAAWTTSLAAVATAPLGARLAHRLPVATLNKALAALLMLVAAHLSWKLLQS
jgi:uncharacterized membrane protein YfcA